MVERAKRLLDRATAGQTVGRAALLISAAYLVSRLLGLLRDRLLVAEFGKGPLLDAYNAAFRLPELLFTLLVSGAFAVAFIPVLTEHLAGQQRDETWRVTSSLLTLLVLCTIGGSLLIVAFADPLVRLVTFGFDPERHRLTVDLTRIMAITPALFAISTVLGSVQQAFHRFLIFSFAGIFYNVGIIVGIIWLAPHWSVYGVAWGVVIGVVLQAVLAVLGLYGLGVRFRPAINLRLAGVRRTLALMVPRSIDQGIDQINYSVETMIGSTLGNGAITALNLANNLKNVPLALIASSITTAAFPHMAARAARGARTELVEGYVQTARLILFMAIPAAVFAVIMRGYIVRLLYGFGDADTANILGWFAGTIIFTSLFFLVSRVYYALQDTRTPLYLSLISIPLNIALSFALSRVYGVVGLSMSASLVATAETLVLLWILNRRHGSFGERAIWRGVCRMLLAASIMALILRLAVAHWLPLFATDRGFLTLAPKFSVLVALGLAVYFLPCYWMHLHEAKIFVRRLKDIMARSLSLT